MRPTKQAPRKRTFKVIRNHHLIGFRDVFDIITLDGKWVATCTRRNTAYAYGDKMITDYELRKAKRKEHGIVNQATPC